MVKPLSIDIRKRVINYITMGGTHAKAAQKYDVFESPVLRWHNRYKETGSCEAKPYPGKKTLLTNEEFIAHVSKNSNSTLKQIGNHFGISAKSAYYYMQKCNFKYKKKNPVTWSLRKENEENI